MIDKQRSMRDASGKVAPVSVVHMVMKLINILEKFRYKLMPPQGVVMDILSRSLVARAMIVAVKLGIPDLLQNGALSYEEIAHRSRTDAKATYRLLRALASAGIFLEKKDGKFQLNAISEVLRTNVPGSLNAGVLLCHEEWHQKSWDSLLYSIKTGKSGFEHVFGIGMFKYFEKYPEAGALFDKAMSNASEMVNEPIIAAYDFSSIRKLVDVGGGNGSLLFTVLKANPSLKGILFDRAPVIDRAKTLFESNGGDVAARCELVSGDFFDSVPKGADAYIMKYCLHDWDDKSAVVILDNCRRAMSEGGRVVVIDIVVPKGNEPSFGTILDLDMLVLTPSGRERTEGEFRELFSQAGLLVSRIVPTVTPMSLIEGVRSLWE